MAPIDQNHAAPHWLEEAGHTGPPPYHNENIELQQIQAREASEPVNIASTQGHQQHNLDDNSSQHDLQERGNTTFQPIQDQEQLHPEERDITDGRRFSILVESIWGAQQDTAVHVAVREAAHRDLIYTHDSIFYDTERNTVMSQMSETTRSDWRAVFAIMMAILSGVITGVVLYYVLF